MNLFDITLKKMFEHRDDIKYINGIAYGILDNDKLFKIQFTLDIVYDAIEVSIINKMGDIIDKSKFLLEELLPKDRTNNTPRIFRFEGKLLWNCTPPEKELCNIALLIDDYIKLFTHQDQELVNVDFQI